MKGKMNLLNPLSIIKTLSFIPFSIKTKALSEMKFLTLSFLYSVSATSTPLFLFLVSSFGCSFYAPVSCLSSFCNAPERVS